MSDTPRRNYEPPTGDEPLDAIEQALVRMWIEILAGEILREQAADGADRGPADPAATDHPAEPPACR